LDDQRDLFVVDSLSLITAAMPLQVYRVEQPSLRLWQRLVVRQRGVPRGERSEDVCNQIRLDRRQRAPEDCDGGADTSTWALLAAPDTMVLVPSREKQRNVPEHFFFAWSTYLTVNKGMKLFAWKLVFFLNYILFFCPSGSSGPKSSKVISLRLEPQRGPRASGALEPLRALTAAGPGERWARRPGG
jgi:hypothetical protein